MVAALALALAIGSAGPAAPGSGAAGPPRLGPAPNFALTTQRGDRLWLTDLRGRAVVLAFGCTACGACPGLVPTLVGLAERVGAAAGPRVVFVLVTLDPARDTPAALRAFARARALRAPAWFLLTEDRAGQVEVVVRRYRVGVRREGARVEAECPVFLVDADGQLRGRYDAARPETLDRGLRPLLGAPAARRPPVSRGASPV
jgi:protein SCO1/2